MSPQIETLAINLNKAEFIISLYSKKASKSVMTMLREIQDQFQARQKQNHTFHQVAQAIEVYYQKKIHALETLALRIRYDLESQHRDMDTLSSRRSSLQQDLDLYESELSDTRDYAEQRRHKKSQREKQYHQLYHVPLVAAQYKKKYMRARDKNADAEAHVSAARSKVDACQQGITRLVRSLSDLQQQQALLVDQLHALNTQLQVDEDVLFRLREGKKFLASFDAHQLAAAQQVTAAFMETVQKKKKRDERLESLFKLALHEYGVAEEVANTTWGTLEVEFQCCQCNTVQRGWPKLDKVRPGVVLCLTCYQKDHRTSMVSLRNVNKMLKSRNFLFT